VTPTNTARRIGRGTRKPENWAQLVRFAVVGASGYVINLVVFWLATDKADLHHVLAAVIAFVVAVTNNFLWNRHWTFRASAGHAGFQAARFLTVSVISLGVNLLILQALIALGMPEIGAQAIAVAVATPVNFIGNKLWTFDGR
jgi:dolichol-phosphate mannosyltransferase